MSNLYKVGGALPLDAPSYIRRQADHDLYEGLLAGEFCYVLNSRQMGKSSLRVQTMRRLQEAGIACATIDITKIGSQGITPEEWYAGLLFTLIKQLQLPVPLQQFEDWWEVHRLLSPVNRFSEFIDGVLLKEIAGKIVIFIDEIDSVLQLNFKDDFFAAIRACYNKRAENPDYDRLTFTLLGVATPSNLIQDKNRTPFNIGRAVQLNGFRVDEAQPLAQGLASNAVNPEAALLAILTWTGGQPFLTQKLCWLVLESNDSIPEGKEAHWIKQLLKSRIIENWESQDEPEHLRTIRDRILQDERRAGRLLGLYQRILKHKEVETDNNPEELELQLSGLAIGQGNKLKISNPIYIKVFDQEWVSQQFARLRPYSETLIAWVESSYQDVSRLLRGQALQKALEWSAYKSLSDLDYRFLSASKEIDIHEANQRKLRQRVKQLRVISILALSTAVIAFAFGWQTFHQQKRAEVAEIRTLNALTKALLNADALKENVETLINSVKTGKMFLKEGHLSGTLEGAEIQGEIEANLKYSIYNVLERNRLLHRNTIFAVAFSPDLNPNNRLIATASADGTAKLWLYNGKLHRILKHQSDVTSVVFSPGGKLVATASKDKTIKIWSRDGQLLNTLSNKNNSFEKVAFSPDGKWIAAVTSDYKIIIWKTQNNEVVGVLDGYDKRNHRSGHKYSFLDINFSPNGKLIAAAGTDKTIKIWSFPELELIQILEGHKDWVYSVSFNPDSDLLASGGGGSDKALKLWKYSRGDSKFKLVKTIEKAHDDALRGSFSPDGKLIATASGDQTLKVWDSSRILSAAEPNLTPSEHNRILMKTIRGHQSAINALSFSPDSQLIALAGTDQTVTLWRLDQILDKTMTISDFRVLKVVFSPDNRKIATAGADSTVKIWDKNGTLLKTIGDHRDWVTGLSFSPDSQLLASASEDGTVKVWHSEDATLYREFKHTDKVYGVSFSPDGQLLASVGADNSLKLWKIGSGELFASLKVNSNIFWTWSISFSPDGKLIAATTRDGVKIWQISNQSLYRTLQDDTNLTETISKISFSPDSQFLAAATINSTTKLWDFKNGKLLTTLKGHSKGTQDVEVSSDGQLIATASVDKTVKFWTRHGELLRTLEGHEAAVYSVSFSPDGSTLVSADSNGEMKFWKLHFLERQSLNLNQLIERGCILLQDYFQANPNANKDNICPEI